MAALAFLSSPWFVVPWYLIGAITAAWMVHDLRTVNTPLKRAMKWGWPIIGFFFSVIGLGLYFLTARPPGMADARTAQEKQDLLADYEQAMWRRVNGAVIHCVAGDGLGIMTAMVIARLAQLTFWQEFWFEYAVGFGFGWLIFQLQSMRRMADTLGQALWMAFRAEFFSMLTVMGGMGAVMAYVTPELVGMQPRPDTAAFWGFGMLGLLVGYVFTFPMNWMLVKIGWKHGMGPAEGARPAKAPAARAALGAAMVVLGAVALAIPARLAALRERTQRELLAAAAEAAAGAPADPLAAGLANGRQAGSAPGVRDAAAAIRRTASPRASGCR